MQRALAFAGVADIEERTEKGQRLRLATGSHRKEHQPGAWAVGEGEG